MASPTDDEIRAKLEEILPTVDLEETGLKKFIKLLSAEFDGVNLKDRKEFIKQALTDALAKQQEEQEESGEEEDQQDDDDDDEDDDSDVPAPKKKGRGGGGLAAKKEISKELQNFLGRGDHMARTEIVKALWDYIREHSLQNPENKKEIILDDAMKQVFGCDKFTMFSMNKYIGAHIHPFKPVDLSAPSTPKPRKRKAAAKGGSSSKKPRKTGTQPPYHLSEALAAVTGTDILPRPQVVSKIWDYIRANGLQNPNDKREILCDEKLKRVMGNHAKVTMFKMNTFISDHLIEKADPASYQHEDNDGDDSD